MKRWFLSVRLLLIVFDSFVIIVAYEDEHARIPHTHTAHSHKQMNKGQQKNYAIARTLKCTTTNPSFPWIRQTHLNKFLLIVAVYFCGFRWRIDETNRWSMRRNQSILMSIQVVIFYFASHQIQFTWPTPRLPSFFTIIINFFLFFIVVVVVAMFHYYFCCWHCCYCEFILCDRYHEERWMFSISIYILMMKICNLLHSTNPIY